MSDKTGGPAFPGSVNPQAKAQCEGLGAIYVPPAGMTLRDYFAAKAMQSLILNQAPELINGPAWEHIIAGAYQAADAMLKARES